MYQIKKRFFVLMYCCAFLAVVAICQIGSNTVTVMTQSAPIENRTVIIIDAGHGGVDGGATSCTGILESHTNLQIALKLNDLMHLLGYETKMIRTTDTSIYTEGNSIAAQKVSDLKNRVKIINETENALLISIHQNTFSDSKYHGAQVFYTKEPISQAMAKEMQSALVLSLNPGSNRQAKPANGVYLMEHIEKPGILIECGFISNPEEAVKLNDPVYQNKLCCVIGTVISRHYTNT